MARCRCHGARTYKRCCRPWHEGRPAPTPEALMRSRYAAYALGLVDYVMDTTDPSGPLHQADRTAWAHQIAAFCEGSRFVGLEVLATSVDGPRGAVHFRAHLSRGGQAVLLEEHSRFVYVGERWWYHAADDQP